MRFCLRLVLLLAGVYVVVAGGLSGKDWPSKEFWQPGGPWFWSLVAAGIVVPIAGFVEYVLSRRGKRNTDLNIVCQQIASKIIDHCNPAGLVPSLLTVAVWRTKKDNTFDRRAQFLLPAERPPSGVKWERGKGVAGSAWDSGQANRWERLTGRSTMTAADYAKLREDKRLGMTYDEWEKVEPYKGVVASALYATTGAPLLGFLVIDYRGPLRPAGTDLVTCIRKALDDRDVDKFRGGLVRRLEEKA